MKNLKLWLSFNAVFSSVSGISALIFNNELQTLFGFDSSLVFPGLGIGLIFFGGYLFYVISKKSDHQGVVESICYADAGWVLGSILIVAFQLFQLSSLGYGIISGVALIVAIFGFQQYRFNKLFHSSRS